MNITINVNENVISDSNIHIDLSGITTYGELKKALPSTGTGRVPGIRQLKQRAKMLLCRKTESGTIEIYDNGFFIFDECGRQTIYGVDRCERPETYTYSGKKEAYPEVPDFSAYPWELILESAGCARLSHNQENREEYVEEYSLDAPASENNPAFSVRPKHEIREEEEEAAERKAAMLTAMEEGLRSLKPRQREILNLRYGKGLTYEEIGEWMGITKGTAYTNCERALKRAQKKILK